MKFFTRILILVAAAALGTVVWRLSNMVSVVEKAEQSAAERPGMRPMSAPPQHSPIGQVGGIGEVKNPYEAIPYRQPTDYSQPSGR